MGEIAYQRKLVQKLESIFPGCLVIRLDPERIQGIPDLLILFESYWGVLEVKPNAKARRQPNQEYYIDLLNKMSFGAIIYPEIEDEVLNALQSAFGY